MTSHTEDQGKRKKLYPGFFNESKPISKISQIFFFLNSFSMERIAVLDNFPLTNNDHKEDNFQLRGSKIIINSVCVNKILKRNVGFNAPTF